MHLFNALKYFHIHCLMVRFHPSTTLIFLHFWSSTYIKTDETMKELSSNIDLCRSTKDEAMVKEAVSL